MKQFTNDMCRERGLTVAKKGKHFDGKEMEQGEVISWSKDKYNLLRDEKKDSYLIDCAFAVLDTVPGCVSREMFMERMSDKGWEVHWQDSRKHITFENEDGNKVRDTNLFKTFQIDVSKEEMKREFERQKEENSRRQLAEYYGEVESKLGGADAEAVIRELDATERASEQKRQNSAVARANRDARRKRSSTPESTGDRKEKSSITEQIARNREKVRTRDAEMPRGKTKIKTRGR